MFFVWYLVFYDFVSFSFSFFIFLRNIYIHIFIYILRSDTKPAVAFTNQYFQNLKPILKKNQKYFYGGPPDTCLIKKNVFTWSSFHFRLNMVVLRGWDMGKIFLILRLSSSSQTFSADVFFIHYTIFTKFYDWKRKLRKILLKIRQFLEIHIFILNGNLAYIVYKIPNNFLKVQISRMGLKNK